MIVLFTDFGLAGPYVGQMKGVLFREAPGIAVVDLFADVPAYDVRAAAYLLAAYAADFEAGSVFLCVVDPGVGTEARKPVVVEADCRWYVGPGNGLFEIVRRRAKLAAVHEILWQPRRLSASFHGRDLFAPVAAMLARGKRVPSRELRGAAARDEWPDDLAQIIYIDHFGNAITGLRASVLPKEAVLEVNGQRVGWARTFGEAPLGTPFWYENANALVEVAVNRGRAAEALGVRLGDAVRVVGPVSPTR